MHMVYAPPVGGQSTGFSTFDFRWEHSLQPRHTRKMRHQHSTKAVHLSSELSTSKGGGAEEHPGNNTSTHHFTRVQLRNQGWPTTVLHQHSKNTPRPCTAAYVQSVLLPMASSLRNICSMQLLLLLLLACTPPICQNAVQLHIAGPVLGPSRTT